MSGWNNRVVHIKEGDWEGYEIREVFYDAQCRPYAHGSACLMSENLDDLWELLGWMQKALNEPVREPDDFKRADFAREDSNEDS
jgi:hypothetical protein